MIFFQLFQDEHDALFGFFSVANYIVKDSRPLKACVHHIEIDAPFLFILIYGHHKKRALRPSDVNGHHKKRM